MYSQGLRIAISKSEHVFEFVTIAMKFVFSTGSYLTMSKTDFYQPSKHRGTSSNILKKSRSSTSVQ